MQTAACTGDSHSGKWPAKCSINMPVKRSSEPKMARWIITGVCFSEFRADVESAETARQVEIDLHRAALPFAADGVAQGIFELRAVKRALARIDRGLEPCAATGRAPSAAPLPPCPSPRPRRRAFPAGRQLHHNIVEAEILVDRHDHVVEPHGFRHDLVFGAENMGVVLGEGAHPHHAVDRARRLVAMDDAEFRDPHRQFAIGFQAVLEDLHMAGAVHRLEREDAFILGLGDEHVLAIGLPMAGRLPQRAVEHLRRIDLDIAGRLLAPAHEGDQGLEQASSPWGARRSRPAPPPGNGTGPFPGRCGDGRGARPPRAAADRRRGLPAWRRRWRRCAGASACVESPRQ